MGRNLGEEMIICRGFPVKEKSSYMFSYKHLMIKINIKIQTSGDISNGKLRGSRKKAVFKLQLNHGLITFLLLTKKKTLKYIKFIHIIVHVS